MLSEVVFLRLVIIQHAAAVAAPRASRRQARLLSFARSHNGAQSCPLQRAS